MLYSTLFDQHQKQNIIYRPFCHQGSTGTAFLAGTGKECRNQVYAGTGIQPDLGPGS